MELALWKNKIDEEERISQQEIAVGVSGDGDEEIQSSHWEDKDRISEALRINSPAVREASRINSGAQIIIPLVLSFLRIATAAERNAAREAKGPEVKVVLTTNTPRKRVLAGCAGETEAGRYIGVGHCVVQYAIKKKKSKISKYDIIARNPEATESIKYGPTELGLQKLPKV